jgi:sirohydrochlorin cobaltochelatase
MTERALILFAHGARDPAWAAPFRRLQGLLQAQQPGLTVTLAFLELMKPDLPACVAQLLPLGVGDITVVPVFLGQGGHVQRDLPELVAALRAAHPGLALRVAAPVGEDASVLDAMAQYCLRSLAA